MTKQPSYRFAGYTEPWEEKKLGDFSDVTKLAGFEFTNHVKYSSTGSIIALRGLNIKNGNIILNDVKYIDESDFSKLHRSKLIINDIMFTYVGTVGELAIIEDNNKFYLAPNVSRIRILNDTYPYFLMQYMWRKSFYQSVIFPLIATSSQPALSMENIRKFNISLPSLPEQTAIGSFFQDIDQLISLQQRKFEVLKEQKKTYLKLLFPAKGQKKPALRFAGFEDEWKEVKLGEILVERNEQISESEEYQLMSFVQGKGVVPKSDRYDRSFLVKDDKKNYKKTEYGDFIYSSNNLDTGSIGFNKTGKALISPVYSIFYSKTKKESQFIAILSQRKEFINEMIKYRQGVVYGQFRIHERDFLNIRILAPESHEQEALITFFQDIDRVIAKQEEKVNHLKESKQTLLRKMFI